MQTSLTIAAVQPATMTSLELVDFINDQRKPGDAILRHDNFMAKVPKVLGEGGVLKFKDTYTNPQNGQLYRFYRFPKREACLMAMSYSYELQAKVFDRMTALEEKQKPAAPAFTLPDFTNPAESARAWAFEYEEREKAQAALALAQPKVQYFDKVVERSTLMTATQVGQKLGMSAVALNKHLDELDVYSKNIKRARVFKQWFIDKGYGELKQTELGHSQPLFTTAGEAWIIERMVSEGVETTNSSV